MFGFLQISSSAESEAKTTTGLVKGHAYSITGVEEVRPTEREAGKPLRFNVCCAKDKKTGNTAGFDTQGQGLGP